MNMRMSKSQEFLDNNNHDVGVSGVTPPTTKYSAPAASSIDSLDRADLAVFDPNLSTQSLRRHHHNHIAKSKTLPAGMTPPSAGDLLAMSMSSAEFDAASKSKAPITKPSLPAPPPHVQRRGHRRNVSDTSSIALALGLDGKRRMMVSTESPLSSAGLPTTHAGVDGHPSSLRPPAAAGGGFGGSAGSLPRKAKPHVASMSSLVDAMTSPSSQEGEVKTGVGTSGGGAAMMHQSLQVAGNARLTSSMDPLSVSTSLLNLSSLKNTDQEQRVPPALLHPSALAHDRHPSAHSLGAAGSSKGASNASLQQQPQQPHQSSHANVAFNPFGDTKNFGELTENELFGKEFDEIRMNTSFTSESNSSTTTSNGSAATVVAAAPPNSGVTILRRGSDEDNGVVFGNSLAAKKRASLTLPDAVTKPMTTSISLDITSHEQ